MAGETQTSVRAPSEIFARLRTHGAPFVLGGLLTMMGLGLHWWLTLGFEAKPQNAMEEMAWDAVKIDASKIDPSHNGKVVFVTSDVRTAKPFGDKDILAPGPYLKLNRIVEVYQTNGGVPAAAQKTATNKAVKPLKTAKPPKQSRNAKKAKSRWKTPKGATAKSSSAASPKSGPVPGRWTSSFPSGGGSLTSAELNSPTAKFGAFDGKFLLAKKMPYKPLTIGAKELGNRKFTTDGTWVYLDGDKAKPRPGHRRVRYEAVRAPEVFSVAGVQKDSSLIPYQPHVGGEPMLLVARGRVAMTTLLPPPHGKGEKAFDWLGHLMAFALVTAGIMAALFPFRESFAFLQLPQVLKRAAFAVIGLAGGTAVSSLFVVSLLIIQTPWLFVGLVIVGGIFAIQTHRKREEARAKRTRSSMVDIPPETQTNVERIA